MRIQSLHLRPFGVFANLRLDFSVGESGGLHLIYGPNGGGKSTTLRAIRSVLFGFEHGSKDAHRFASKDLRLEAQLLRSAGESLHFVRRNSKKSPLWDADDAQPISLESLPLFLGGLNRAQYESIYGLDYETMVAGGEDLLRGQGELGRALFGASLGGKHLAQVTERLQTELSGLYGDNAIKSRMNLALRQWQQLSTDRNKASTSFHAYDKLRKELNRALKQDAELRSRRSKLQAERESVDNQRRAFACFRRWEQASDQRAGHGDRQPLPHEVIQRLRDLDRESERIAEAAQTRIGERATRVNQGAELELRAEQKLLDAGEAIDELCSRVPSFDAAVLALPKAQEDRQDARSRMGEGLAGLRKGVESRAASQALHQHTSKRQRTLSVRESSRKERDRAQVTWDAAKRALDGLQQSIAERFGPQLTKLAPFHGSLADLEVYVPPAKEVIQARLALEAERADAERQRTHVQARLQHQKRESQAVLDGLANDPRGIPPTEQDVLAARVQRDALWRVLGDAGLKGAAVSAAAVSEYMAAVTAADQLADGLRRDLARASEASRANRTLAQFEQELAQAQGTEIEARAKNESEDAAWVAAWGFVPLEAAAMQRWSMDRDALLERVVEQRAQIRSENEQARNQFAEREAQLQAADADHAQAELAFGKWASDLGLDPDAGEEFASERLRELDAAGHAAKALERLEPECEGLQAMIADFERDASNLVRLTGVGLEVDELDAVARARQRVERMRETLQDARSAALEWEHLQKLERASADHDSRAEKRHLEIGAELDQLVHDSGSASLEQLRLGATESDVLRGLDEQMRVAEAELAALPHAWTPVLAKAALDGRTLSEIESEYLEAGVQMTALEEELVGLREQIGSLRASVERDGGDAAAVIESDKSAVLAELELDTERFLTVQLARFLLQREVERHREQNQGPLLERAGQLFRTLTVGTFERLIASEDHQGRFVIAACRPGGASEGVERMSTGARDQLYLALRIASVEQMMQSTEPMPFVADDLFVNFDDERTEASLRVLFELAQSTQVIVFSHHKAVVETAQRLSAGGVPIHVHDLAAERIRERAHLKQEDSPA